MNIRVVLFLFFILLWSCKELADNNSNEIVFNEKDVKSTNIESSEILNVSDSIISSNFVLIVGDKFIANETAASGLFHAITLADEKYIGLYGKKGRGPGELGYPMTLAKNSDTNLQVFDFQERKLVEFNTDSLNSSNSFQKETPLKNMVGSTAAIIKDNKVFSLSRTKADSRLYIADLEGNIVEGIGSLPKINKALPENTIAEGHPGRIQLWKNNFAISYLTTPVVQLYNIKSKIWISINGPEHFPSIIEENENEMIALAYTNETRMGYLDIKIGTKYVYALYSGKNLFATENINSNIVYVFDLEGNPIEKFVLDKAILTFDVYKDRFLYGISQGLKTKMYKFDLAPKQTNGWQVK